MLDMKVKASVQATTSTTTPTAAASQDLVEAQREAVPSTKEPLALTTKELPEQLREFLKCNGLAADLYKNIGNIPRFVRVSRKFQLTEKALKVPYAD